MSKFSHAIALTGGIATGKSTAVKILCELGFEVIDADQISHQIFSQKSDKIAQLFGTTDRKAIAAIIFANKTKKSALEQLLHPAIKDEILRQALDLEGKNMIYFVDIPLFFETNNYPFSRSLLIYATKELQLARMQNDRNLTNQEATTRLNSQMDIEEKRSKATWVIENMGSKEDLKHSIEQFLQTIK